MISNPLRMQKNSAGCRFLGNIVEVERQRTGHFELAPLFREAYSDEDLVHSLVDLFLTSPAVPMERRWALAF